MSKRIAILGSTGSIGIQSLDVIAESDGFQVTGLSAGTNAALLAEQCVTFNVPCAALAEKNSVDWTGETTLLQGPQAAEEMLDAARPDIVISSVVGSAGLKPTLRAIELGATVALANKESLVCAGSLVMPAARAAGVNILPVDSEHAGIFQCLGAEKITNVRRVIITSSGGALRDFTDAQAEKATAKEALAHPTWQMGPKITIDSATLMNKVLEVIEAHWLFGLSADQIDVVIHPQSIVHAMVEFCDGSVIAQLAEPDMKLPIAFALHYPEKQVRDVPPLDLHHIARLDFHPVEGRFQRAVDLAYRVIEEEGASGAVLNGANEAAVEAFLAGHIRFGQIVPLVEAAMDARPAGSKTPSLSDLLDADAWAREFVQSQIT